MKLTSPICDGYVPGATLTPGGYICTKCGQNQDAHHPELSADEHRQLADLLLRRMAGDEADAAIKKAKEAGNG